MNTRSDLHVVVGRVLVFQSVDVEGGLAMAIRRWVMQCLSSLVSGPPNRLHQLYSWYAVIS